MIYLAYLFYWLELLGLSVLVGGMVVLGALVAPTVFSLLPPMSTGGEVMSTLFRRFNSIVTFACLGLIAIGFLGKLTIDGLRTKIRLLEGAALAVIFAVGIYMGGFLTPQMDELRNLRIQEPSNHRAVEEFGAAHRLSQGLFGINFVLGLMVLYLNGMEMARNQKPAGP